MVITKHMVIIEGSLALDHELYYCTCMAANTGRTTLIYSDAIEQGISILWGHRRKVAIMILHNVLALHTEPVSFLWHIKCHVFFGLAVAWSKVTLHSCTPHYFLATTRTCYCVICHLVEQTSCSPMYYVLWSFSLVFFSLGHWNDIR